MFIFILVEWFHIYTKIGMDLKMLMILHYFNMKYFGKEKQRYRLMACVFSIDL